MRTKGAAYFLVLLLAWAQADDAWAAIPLSPSAPPLGDTDEEYLQGETQRCREQSAEGPAPGPLGVRTGAGVPPSPLQSNGAPEARAPLPFGPPPLYVLMSLQL
jgi:hypothetical protein